jgi:hypothetical protein
MKTIQEDESEPSAKEFCLLRAPGSYTLAEMFDDRINYVEDSSNNQQQHEQRDGLPPNEQQKMIPRTSGSSYMVQNRNQQPSETFWNQQQPRRTTISKQLSMPNIAWNPCNLQQQQQQFYGSADEMQKFAEFNTPSRQRGIQMASPTVSAMPVQVPYRIGESQAQRTSHQYYCSPYPHQPPPMQGCSSRSSEYYTHQFSPSMHNSLPYEMNSQGHLAPNSYCYPTQNTTLYYPTPATYNNSSAYFNNNTSQ